MSSSQMPSTATRRHGSALRVAFPLTVPTLAGFLLTGATCGIYASSLGLPWWAPTFMAVAFFAGSAEFIVASMLVELFNPLAAFVTIFAVNARHLFYGVSMLDKYAHVKRRPYLIYAMCDETFSVNFSGISFALTALFVVIFLNQWLKDASHVSSVIALLAFGPSNFVVPALVLILAAVTLVRSHVEPAYGLDRAVDEQTRKDGDAA